MFSSSEKICNTPCQYVKPCVDGHMPFDDNQFGLIVSLGVLHHIPNVSHVMTECNRVLSKDGIMLIREPIVSMGDWSKPRKGLTRNERGIPYDIFKTIIAKTGFNIKHSSFCSFAPLLKISNKFGIVVYNNRTLTKLDVILSNMFRWNIKYHPTKLIHKFMPASAYFILEKI
jgi:SAM-dependent methyltransferase